MTGWEKQVAYQQAAHNRLPKLQEDLIMSLSLRKFDNELQSMLANMDAHGKSFVSYVIENEKMSDAAKWQRTLQRKYRIG